MKIAGKVALVTGASRGIGREVALGLGRAGASVAVVARDREKLEAVAQQIGDARSQVIVADLAQDGEVRSAFASALQHFGHIDILVNNAARVTEQDFLKTDVDALAGTVDLNFRAAVVLTRLAAEQMADRRSGHIVNVASLAGVTGIPGEAVYAGAKAALRLFTASLRPELAPFGIHLTDVVLGFITTDMLAQADAHPRVGTLFNRARRLRLMRDTPASTVGSGIVRAIEREQEVLVIPPSSRYLYMTLPGLSRKIVRLLSPRG